MCYAFLVYLSYSLTIGLRDYLFHVFLCVSVQQMFNYITLQQNITKNAYKVPSLINVSHFWLILSYSLISPLQDYFIFVCQLSMLFSSSTGMFSLITQHATKNTTRLHKVSIFIFLLHIYLLFQSFLQSSFQVHSSFFGRYLRLSVYQVVFFL